MKALINSMIFPLQARLRKQKIADSSQHLLNNQLQQRDNVIFTTDREQSVNIKGGLLQTCIIIFRMISNVRANILILIVTHICVCISMRQECRNMAIGLSSASDSEANSLLQQLDKGKCLTPVTPRYRWSQNMSHIQVKIEYTATTHTAPCDKVLYTNKTATHSSFDVRLLCFHARLLIDYRLTVVTYKSLDFQFAQWKNGEQNSIILECLKSPAPYFWPILHSRTNKPSKAPKVWWQMLSKYGPELRKVIDLLEIGDEDNEISKKVKNKLKKPENQKKRIDCSWGSGSAQYLANWL